jgi:O-antigen/teichoic acid export membrane protein
VSSPDITGRAIARNTGINLVGQILPLLMALFAIPILVSELGIERFGVLSLILIAIGFFGMLDLGLSRALTQLISERVGKGETQGLKASVWSALAVMLVMGFIGALLTLLMAPWLVGTLFRISPALRADSLSSFMALAVSIPFVVTSAGFLGILAAQQRFDLINAINVPAGIASFLTPVLVLSFFDSLFAAVAAIVLVRIMSWAAYLLVCMRKVPYLQGRPRLDTSVLRPLLRYGGWMTVSNLVSPIMVYMDRFLLGSIVSMTAVAYYSTPYDLVTRLWILPTALLGTMFPAFASSFAKDPARTASLLEGSVRYMFFAVFPIVLVMLTLAPEGLQLWLGGEFSVNSTPVLRWLAVGIFLNCFGQIAFAAVQGAGRPDLTGKLHVLELPIYLIVLWWLVLRWGIEGAAMAWTIRVAVDTIVLFVLAHNELGIHLRAYAGKITSMGGVLALFAAACWIEGLWLKGSFLLAGLFVFGVIGWSRLLGDEERRIIVNFVGRPKRAPAST